MIKPTLSELKLHAKLIDPLQKKTTLSLTVSKYYTDINGSVIAKNDVRIPAALKTDFPIWLFGQFDRSGGYRIANQVAPSRANTFFVCQYVNGIDLPPLFATGLNTIENYISNGDLVTIFTDNINAPSSYVYIVQSGGGNSIASVLQNSIRNESNLKVFNLNYVVSQSTGAFVLQFQKGITAVNIDSLGGYTYKSIDPTGFLQTNTQQPNFVKVPITFPINQYNLLTTYMDYTADIIQLSFQVYKNTLFK